ncbi:MAG: F0F1 ATP synthase subunit gamma [Rickettsiales bacterium]|jgi:F-type H+-transporting ATPase subunit gamma|nr:F0F1 ATP synthase subunit gamma [Rickettsiales bacterium]
MDALNALKNNLKSTNNLKEIVFAMKAMAVANIKIYEKVVLNLLKYQSNIDLGLQAIIKQHPKALEAYSSYAGEGSSEKNRNSRKTIALVIGSNQGLCGKFNDKIVDFFIENIHHLDTYYVVTVGNRVNTLVNAKKINVNKHFSMPNSKKQLIWLVYSIFNFIDLTLTNDRLTRVVIYFTNYSTKGAGSPTKKRILPLDRKSFDKLREKEWPTNNIPYWRLDSEKLISGFVQQCMFVNIYLTLVNSIASEQISRIETLQGAEQNIKDRISEITLQINQTRQNTITTELLDMISGVKLLLQKLE